jgi:hypothetical protein
MTTGAPLEKFGAKLPLICPLELGVRLQAFVYDQFACGGFEVGSAK